MKKLHSLILSCVGLISLSSYTAVYAGNQEGAFSVTPGIGDFFLSSKRNMENAGVPLVILGYDFTHRWGIEGLLGGYNTNFKGNRHNHKEINGTLFAIDGVYRFGPYYQVIEPYVLAGIGVIGMNPNNNDANNEGNINAGIGAQFFIHKAIAFRVEARDFYTWVGGKNDVMVDAGVSVLFNIC
jgi:OmpA-OmpF porin, OOP family